MKLSLFTSVVLASLVAAQQEKLPKCAQPCVDQYTTGGGVAGCGQLDIKCICSNQNFLSGIACCLEEKCDAEGKETAVKYAKQICATAGVTDLPDDVKCDKSTASGTASGSATGATTPTASVSTSTASATGESSNVDTNAGSREGAAGFIGVGMAMLLAL
ncbi:cell wall protein [Fusarium langsethiae]|uniref:Cell wall protein n=1 Tax=Fusarium langsethiae TaxID=179993 RepID=A0A0M9F5X4_FUSLA|nr:cell wall protein [Fusarium langsethiae]GKT98773.1 unnamed protein product [Fusarium langsethiae]GKU10306.1 unnamed protein product [Fusarium langsethiae]